MVRRERVAQVLVLALTAAACGSGSGGAGSSSASNRAQTSGPRVLTAADDDASASTSSTAKPAEVTIVSIPAGTLVAGSIPGDKGRDPTLEPPSVSFDLPAFDIDRYLYPNEPGRPPKLGASRSEAEQLCKQKGRRLCTELEWERACKGPDNELYAGRAAWDSACNEAPEKCASSFGVAGMGSFREWTASDVEPPRDSGVKKGAAVRGASREASDVDRRCAHRTSLSADAGSGIGFRCCGGAAAEARITPVVGGPSFEKIELAASDLAELFATVPNLAKLGKDLEYFDPEAAPKTVMERADAGDTDPKGYVITTQPVLWRPVIGEEIVIAAGLAGKETTFIVAMHKLEGGRYRIASTLVMKGDPGPVVLAFDRSVTGRLEWSSCWQCRAESGRITYRDDGRVLISQE
ncbi:MAG: SUMF1/EgtB/PvdO family nonheme iron enzyme [Polyangiaceae bacterium]